MPRPTYKPAWKNSRTKHEQLAEENADTSGLIIQLINAAKARRLLSQTRHERRGNAPLRARAGKPPL